MNEWMNEIGTSNTFTIIYKNTMYMLLEKMTNQPIKQTNRQTSFWQNKWQLPFTFSKAQRQILLSLTKSINNLNY